MFYSKYIFRSMKQYILPAAVVFTALTTILISLCLVVSRNTMIGNKIEIWIEACTWADFFLPLIVCTAFVPPVFAQGRRAFIRYASLRCGRRKYLMTQFADLAFVTIAVIWAAYYISLVISLKYIDPVCTAPDNNLLNYVFGSYEAFYPYSFGMLWCLWKGIVASLFVMFGSLLALYAGNLIVPETDSEASGISSVILCKLSTHSVSAASPLSSAEL